MNCGLVSPKSMPYSVACIHDNKVPPKIDNNWMPEILIGHPDLFFGSLRSAIIRPPEIIITGKIKKSKYGFSTVVELDVKASKTHR